MRPQRRDGWNKTGPWAPFFVSVTHYGEPCLCTVQGAAIRFKMKINVNAVPFGLRDSETKCFCFGKDASNMLLKI